MNEELRIIIRAVTDEAKKNMAAVRKELEGIQDTSTESGKAVDTAMKGMAKGALAAIGAITALTAAMTTLGKSAQELQKGFDKLNTTFLNAGSTTAQASQTYKELFSFLGDHDKAIETAQSLALITNEEEELTQWTNALMGAFAEMGDKLPIEGLAEAANATAKIGQVDGVMADALEWKGVSLDSFNASLAQCNSLEEREALILNTLIGLYGSSTDLYKINNQATIDYNNSQSKLNETLAQASSYTTPLLTSLNNLSSTLLTSMAPALEAVAIYLTAFVELLGEAVVWVANFFGLVGSGSADTTDKMKAYQAAMSDYQAQLSAYLADTNSGTQENIKNLEKLKKVTMGFDELNVVNPGSTNTGITGGGNKKPFDLKPPKMEDFGLTPGAELTEFNKKVQTAMDNLEPILWTVGAIGGALGLWKIGSFVHDVITTVKKSKELTGVFEQLKGDLDPVSKEFGQMSDSMKDCKKDLDEVNGRIDKWKSVGGMLLIVAGAISTILGYIDAIKNGLDLGNMIAVLAGLAAIVGGIALKFGGLATPIAVVVAGVAALVLGIIDLVKQGPSFENVFMIAAGAIAILVGALILIGKENLKAAASWVAHHAALLLCIAGIALIIGGMIDFINNGPTVQNTILIIGGAIAVAVGLATAGLSVLLSAIIAAVAAVAAFTAAILLEKPAIMSVEEAQKNLTAAKEAAAEAENGYINAVDAAEAAMNRLKEAEEAAGVTGEELYKQVQDGTLDYANMTDAQKEVYKAYLDNEQKQKDLEASTKALNDAKKAETIASYENQLALAKESGNYEEFKKSVVAAFEAGELSADEARELIGKSMSEMGDDAQKTFMEDLPGSISKGLDPSKYETTGKKMKDWFKKAWKDIKGFFSDAGEWFAGVGKKVGEALSGAFKKVINWVLEKIESTVNAPFKMINKGIDILNKVPGIEITKLGLISIPRLATGGIVTSSTIANIGEAGREAVLPLENNTGWMDVLADRIASRNNTPSRIVLMLDGRELGWASINSINGITKQTGNLQLALG